MIPGTRRRSGQFSLNARRPAEASARREPARISHKAKSPLAAVRFWQSDAAGGGALAQRRERRRAPRSGRGADRARPAGVPDAERLSSTWRPISASAPRGPCIAIVPRTRLPASSASIAPCASRSTWANATAAALLLLGRSDDQATKPIWKAGSRTKAAPSSSTHEIHHCRRGSPQRSPASRLRPPGRAVLMSLDLAGSTLRPPAGHVSSVGSAEALHLWLSQPVQSSCRLEPCSGGGGLASQHPCLVRAAPRNATIPGPRPEKAAKNISRRFEPLSRSRDDSPTDT